MHEGKVAAEVAAGQQARGRLARDFPHVAYTDPEIAWVGLTESDARAKRHRLQEGRIPLDGERPAHLSLGPRGGFHQACCSILTRAAVLGGGNRGQQRPAS